jgi:hypothetical protein
MDSGFLILVFLAIAVIQGIGQKRREAAKKAGKPPGGQPPGQAPSQAGAEFDPAPREGARGGTSEGLIPSEVWDEILGLARGKTGGPKTPADLPSSRPAPEEATEAPARSQSSEVMRRPAEAMRRPPEAMRRPSDSRPSQQAPAPVPLVASSPVPILRRESPSRAEEQPMEGGIRGAQTRLFGQGSTEELRKAIILKEVLGPPLALRDEVR